MENEKAIKALKDFDKAQIKAIAYLTAIELAKLLKEKEREGEK